MFKICENKPRNVCAAYRCSNKPKTGTRLCSRHVHIRRKLQDPIGYVFDSLKANAKRRNKVFELTRSQFEQIIEGTGYMERRGRRPDSLTLERKDPLKGYVWGNVIVITLFENSVKGATEDKTAHNSDLPF